MKILSILFFSAILSGPAFAKSFVYCSEGSPSSFNPQLTTDGTSANASATTIYNRLVEFEKGSSKLIPGLATSWEISRNNKDQMVYTFNLRPGVKFHSTKYFTPSRDMNADDIIFSIERQRTKTHPYHNVSGGKYEYFEGMEMGSLISSVKAVTSLKVQITLSRIEAPFLANMAMSFMSILSAEYAQKLSLLKTMQELDNLPIGTGPFAFQSYSKDSAIRYNAHKTYWGKRGNIEKLIFAITPDANVRTQKLKTGECQFVNEPAPADIADLKKNGSLAVMEAAGLNVGYLAMNVTKKPFDNLMVRKAINHALNRQTYINAIYMGNATVAKNPLPPTIWSYNNSVVDYDYNPAKAIELLKKAGFPNGFETEIWTLPVARPYNPNGKKMGELMQADLKKVGIKATLVSYDWPTYLEKSKNGSHQMLQIGWTGDNGDPDNFLNVLLGCSGVISGSNYSRWCHGPFDKLITEGKLTSDVKLRTTAYMAAQKIFKEEAPWVTIAHSKVFRVMAKNVKNYKIDPLGQDYLAEIIVE